MFHPSVLAAYLYRRTECQSNPVDACSDVAMFHGVSMVRLAQFIIIIGIDADRLSMIT